MTKLWNYLIISAKYKLQIKNWGLTFIILNILSFIQQMNETYDVVVCGTGLTECILSGLLSQEGI